MKNKRLKIEIENKERVSAIVTVPDEHVPGSGVGVILAHGSQNDMENPLIVSAAAGLAKAGNLSLRFNFPYREQGKKSPGLPAKLIKTWLAVYGFLESHKKIKDEPGH